ncbi:MAG: DGQHR domain-containing protein [Myxococcales bacterium]|nr:DGQHR domain-containing protein [Myxococcales bacterium]
MQVQQSRGQFIYSFAIDGKLIPEIASVSRIKRTDDIALTGYQRPEVYSHIEEIRSYLESPQPMIPNGVVIAFDERVAFKPAKARTLKSDPVRVGTLRIPRVKDGDPRPGFIVDGQQRLAAVREAHIKSFPIIVNAFITDDLKKQTEQFILVNATKPLPKGLLYELLPHTNARLPTQLHRRRLAAELLEQINHDSESPLFHMIRTPTSPTGVIRDNSILKMLTNSLSDGALFKYRGTKDAPADVQKMLGIIYEFWRAVHHTFPDAWGQNPRRSRLMHGAGIVAVGNLMDHFVAKYPRRGMPKEDYYRSQLAMVAPICAWTKGSWAIPGNRRKWNEVQNTRQDVALLTEFLQRSFDQVEART